MSLKGKKVLVTGADGFIGSHLVERLVAEGCAVRALAQYNSFNNWGWLENLETDVLKKVEVVTGDIRDPFQVKEMVNGCDVVFHLAALIAIPYSYQAPQSYVDTNVTGTLNIVQACKECGTKRVLVTSTSEVYGTALYVPIDEKHSRQGQSPYSASKIGADAIADSFYRSFNVPLTIVRPFNTYGPRQSARAVIPTIITQLLNGAPEVKLGSLHPTRDFVFVKDTAEAFVQIANCDKAIGEEINIASQHEISIGDMAKQMISQIKPDAKIKSDDVRVRPENSEVERLLGSREKITKLTGWKPNYTFEKGIQETIAWFKKPENLKNYKWNIYNV
ncbi:MAG: NAD-dependent 4,6-dehydratase LegB [Flavobacteriales bacterium]